MFLRITLLKLLLNLPDEYLFLDQDGDDATGMNVRSNIGDKNISI